MKLTTKELAKLKNYHSIPIYPFLVAINCIANYICIYISNTTQLPFQFYHCRNEILQLAPHIKYIHTGVTMVTTPLFSDWLKHFSVSQSQLCTQIQLWKQNGKGSVVT